MRRTFVAAGAAALLLGTGGGVAAADEPAWVITQNKTLPHISITGLTVAPTGSAWAVGFSDASGKDRTAVWRLSGSTWRQVTTPKSWSIRPKVVDASSSKNVWAFGDGGAVIRWNGRKWASGKLPGGYTATDAKVVSASDVWAVNGTASARHWNGKKWLTVRLPAKATAIDAVSAKSIWAAGSLGDKAVVMRSNGSAWKKISGAAPPKPRSDAMTAFYDITVSGKNVWAVGGQSWPCGVDDDDTCYRPVALRLSGSRSAQVIGPKNAPHLYVHSAADGSGGIWALQGVWNPRFVHLDAAGQITYVTAPRPTGYDIALYGIENRPGTATVWAAGGSYPAGDPDEPIGYGVFMRTG